MKNKILMKGSLVVLAALMCGGATLFANHSGKTEFVISEATQHADNYAAYTYSGTYYNGISDSATEGMKGTLRSSLTSLIYPKEFYKYSGDTSTALGTILQSADEDPTNSSNMVLIYTRDSITKRPSASAANWNREHVWPQANSNGCWGTDKAGTDILHIRPTYETCNSSRDNLKYGTATSGAQSYNGMPYGYKANNVFAPLDASKGDVARICMYIWVAYYEEYGTDLPSITKVFESFDTMMKWHVLDRPDALEGHRNDYSEKTSKQKNRNPFVDHPEYAWKIFGSQCSASVLAQAKAAYPADGQGGGGDVPPDPEGSISINKSIISLEAGKSTTIIATSSDSSVISWSTSNSNVLAIAKTYTLSGAELVLTGKKEGQSTVSASATIGGQTYTKSCVVNVKAASSKGGGCGGTIIGSSVLISLTAAGLLCFLLIRRKKYN